MPPERRAVLLLLGLAVGGQALRIWASHPSVAPGEATLLPALPAGASPTAHRDSGVTLARPLGPGETIDLDVAPALEVARLPKVGPRLAKAIVADREARGPFGSLAALDRVPGVGQGLLQAIQSNVTFSATVPAERAAEGGPSGPPAPGALANAAVRPRRVLNLNTASASDLETLPFIGPGLALRIVAFRQKHGPFPVVDSLVRVPGIGPSALAKVRDLVAVE
jgi:competence ComEA-like helix-hairpin-helix protein